MGQILTLHLVNDLGSDSISGSQSDVPSLWPGTATPYDFSLTPQAIRPVWVGVSADGTTNQVYPLGTSVATITGAGWPRVYQGTEIVGNHGDVLVFSEQYPAVLRLLAACCASQVNTQALALLQSRYSLDPEQGLPPCGAEAIFKWLMIYGSAETRELSYQIGFTLLQADGDVDNGFNWFENGPLPATHQLVHAWPAGFYGIVDSVGNARYLVADDDSTTDPNAVPVGYYAGGTITVVVTVYDPLDEGYVFQDIKTFRLPGTDCAQEGSASSSGESSSGGEIPPVGFTPNIRARAIVTAPGQLRSLNFDTGFDVNGMVNFGDGSGDQPLVGSGGEFDSEHTYAEPGTYVVQIRVDDPLALSALQIAGGGDAQMNAHEFLVPFPNLTEVNLTGADELTAFDMTNLPAVTLATFNFTSLPVAQMDDIVAKLDAFGQSNGQLLFNNSQVGAVPTVNDAYNDLTVFLGWTITHD